MLSSNESKFLSNIKWRFIWRREKKCCAEFISTFVTMIKTIKIKELKPGMYITLPTSWRAHPFLRNSFTITSTNQIQKLMSYGIKEVNIDEVKGFKAEAAIEEVQETEKILKPDNSAVKSYGEGVTEVRGPEKEYTNDIRNISEKLTEVLADKKIIPEKKAQVIQDHSVDMMKVLWQNPSAERIAEFKKSVVVVVDNILTDDATSSHLLKLTSYDYNTYIHSVNVGVLAISLAKELFKKENKHDMHALGTGYFLHDLGKVHISEDIINKPGKLTEEEMTIMRRHPTLGYRLLEETKQITEESRLIVLEHHERYNGAGYPRKLRGEEIHIYGRICSVADVFDALVSKRPYKVQLKPFEALKIMKEEMIDHFHKEVFQSFVMLFI